MSTEAEFSEQFYDNSKKFFSERVDYASVTALLLYWEDNDFHPEEEVDAIRELFERDFGFSSLTFSIPSRRAQQELNREISAFVSNYSNKVDSLILVYYAGHGDVEDDGKSVWAACVHKEEGGSTLLWWKAQQLLYDAVGDVLTILDCCSAALVVKGDRHGHKFEMLGASAKGVRTPEPGKSSFTSILIKHVRRSLKKAQQINARSLHGELLEDSKLTETPQYADLTGNNPRSIVLQPLKNLEHEGFVKKPGSFLLLKVSLAEDPIGFRIADWLKSYTPEGVTAVSVEALILKARRLQGLVNQSAFPPGSTFGKLSEGAKTEILHRLQGLNTVLYSADQLSTQVSVSSAEAPLAADSIQAIGQSVEAVCKAVEAPLLLDEPFAGIEEMDQASGDAAAIAGAEEAISLRRQILNIAATPGNLELPRDVLHLPRIRTNSKGALERFRSGTFGVGMNLLDILVESFEIDRSGNIGAPPYNPSASLIDFEQIERKAALLRQTKRASFHILPCIGYIREPLSYRFGFVFERPPDANGKTNPVTLNELYKRSRSVPLGLRIRLAHELVAALENFHRVGWVHKAISSHNIIFLPRDPSARVTPHCVRVDHVPTLINQASNMVHLASPWLFGFDDSRPDEDATNLRVDHSLGNNIYRHPDRWSKPRIRFTKAHDVYSLGIVLLEIAFWQNAISKADLAKPPPDSPPPRLDAEEIRDSLIAKCTRQLPYHVGQVFTSAILECLHFQEKTKDMTAYEQHRYFVTNIADGLAKAVGRV
ncbi:hypothetical protein Q9189_000737 [Teloschistes chrysophthalmus]